MDNRKPFEIIYTDKVYGMEEGKRYSNPRYFTTPRAKATKVYLDGDWPKVEAAYKAAGVPVEHLGAAEAAKDSSANTKSALTIGKGPGGRWYVKFGKTVHSGPYANEAEAEAALAKEVAA